MRRGLRRIAFALSFVCSAPLAWVACSSFESDAATPIEAGAIDGTQNDVVVDSPPLDAPGVDSAVDFCADAGKSVFCADFETTLVENGWTQVDLRAPGSVALSTAQALSPIRSFKATSPAIDATARLLKEVASNGGYVIELALLISGETNTNSALVILFPRKDINIKILVNPEASSYSLTVERSRFLNNMAFAEQLGLLVPPNTWRRIRITVPPPLADASAGIAEDAQAARFEITGLDGTGDASVSVPITGTPRPDYQLHVGANNGTRDATVDSTVVVHYDDIVIRQNP